MYLQELFSYFWLVVFGRVCPSLSTICDNPQTLVSACVCAYMSLCVWVEVTVSHCVCVCMLFYWPVGDLGLGHGDTALMSQSGVPVLPSGITHCWCYVTLTSPPLSLSSTPCYPSPTSFRSFYCLCFFLTHLVTFEHLSFPPSLLITPTFWFHPFSPSLHWGWLQFISPINFTLSLFHLLPLPNKRQTELNWGGASSNLQADTNIFCRKCLFSRWQTLMDWPHQTLSLKRRHTHLIQSPLLICPRLLFAASVLCKHGSRNPIICNMLYDYAWVTAPPMHTQPPTMFSNSTWV